MAPAMLAMTELLDRSIDNFINLGSLVSQRIRDQFVASFLIRAKCCSSLHTAGPGGVGRPLSTGFVLQLATTTKHWQQPVCEEPLLKGTAPVCGGVTIGSLFSKADRVALSK